MQMTMKCSQIAVMVEGSNTVDVSSTGSFSEMAVFNFICLSFISKEGIFQHHRQTFFSVLVLLAQMQSQYFYRIFCKAENVMLGSESSVYILILHVQR